MKKTSWRATEKLLVGQVWPVDYVFDMPDLRVTYILSINFPTLQLTNFKHYKLQNTNLIPIKNSEN